MRAEHPSFACGRPQAFGGQDFYNTWTYKKIVPMERIAYVLRFANADGREMAPAKQGLPAEMPQAVRHEVTFRSLSHAKTEVTVTEYDWTVGELREMYRMGLEQCLDKMAAVLAE